MPNIRRAPTNLYLPATTRIHWGGGYADDVSTSSVYCGLVKDVASDTVKSAAGQWRPPLPYSREIIQGVPGAMRCFSVLHYVSAWDPKSYIQFDGWQDFSGGYYWSPPGIDTGMKSRAEIQALSKLKNQNVNLAVAFGERKACAQMLTNTVKGIRDGVKAIRRLDPRAFTGALRGRSRENWLGKDLANRELEVAYGWNPLMSDIHGTVEEITNRDERFKDRYRLHVKGYGIEKGDDTRQLPEAAFGGTVKATGKQRRRYHNRVMVRLDYVLEDPALATFASLGLTNPAELAWELIPFSFVADWFVPIGSWLGALDASLGWGFIGGSRSELTRANYFSWIEPGSQYLHQNSQVLSKYIRGSGRWRYARLDRHVYSASPIPYVPRLSGDPINGQRATNAIALLAQAFT